MIKRFNPDFSLSISHELAYMRETPEGGYVDYRDYASLFSQFEALKADRDALEQRFADVLAENANLLSAVGEVYAAGYNHGHLNTVDGMAYTDGVEETFAERGAQVLAESSELPATSNTPAQFETLIAENASLKEAITTHSQSTHFCELCGKDDPCSNDDVCYALNETPATSAALAAVRNQARIEGVEMFSDFLGKKYQCEKGNTAKAKALKHVVFLACRFAAELLEAK